MPKAVMDFAAITSSFIVCGNAFKSKDEALLSSRDHFFCCNSGVGLGVLVNLSIGDSFMW